MVYSHNKQATGVQNLSNWEGRERVGRGLLEIFVCHILLYDLLEALPAELKHVAELELSKAHIHALCGISLPLTLHSMGKMTPIYGASMYIHLSSDCGRG